MSAKDMQPLDVRTITLSRETVPALDPRWIEKIKFISYKAPINTDDKAGMDEWMETTGFIVDDLDILLRMPHHKFWCQAIFDITLHQCIDSYLRFAPRSYDIVYALPKDVKERHDSLHRLFFMTCLRMATHKESKDSYITPSVFGEILYENFLFDIPKIMDICVLYGPANGPLLEKMITNIFTQQPKYIDDLREIIPTLLHVLESITHKCGGHLCLGGSGSPVKITPGQANKNLLITMPLSEFQDIIFYLSDTANTIHAFLEIYTNAAKVFMQAGDFVLKLVAFYEYVVPTVTEALQERQWEGSNLDLLLRKKLHQSQVTLIKVFRKIVFHSCLQKILETTSEDAITNLAEEYITTMSAILGEKRFLAHLDYLYPFRQDSDIIIQSKYAVDETRLQFIQDAIFEACSVYMKRPHVKLDAISTSAGNAEVTTVPIETANNISENPEELGACAPKMTGVELQSIISNVKDLLPDLGEGFIELCLDELDYDIEKVINCVLEDKLPPSLQEIDRTMERDVSKVADEVKEIDSLLDKRLNVYDNDEFDAFRNKLDTSKVFMGKKEKAPKSMKELDAERDLSSVKALYDKYGSEDVESMYVPSGFEYEDEYDDTYDSNLVGADDADSADELTNRRQFTVFAGRNDPNTDGIGESVSDSDDDGTFNKRRDQFVEDPAVIRQRQEQRRLAMQQRGGRRPHGGQQHKQYDVVGSAKGQGQEKDTIRNRAWKEKNKSTRVHHNRKNLSDKKRNF